MKVFLAAPFTSKIDNGRVNKNYKQLLKDIKEILERKGCEVHLAMEKEKWGEIHCTDNDCTKRDYRDIKESEILLALFDGAFSGGVHIELGWASEMKKRIIILTNNGKNLCSLVKGLKMITKCDILKFENKKDLNTKIKNKIEKLKNMGD